MTSRRDFLRVSGGCLAHVMLMSACASRATKLRWTAPANPTVTTTPFARLDAIAADTWAVISTPLGGDRTTYANGGIIAGRNGVIAIEGFYRPAGATWLAERARELTGRWPTHVVLTHYHVDHASGVSGYHTPTTAGSASAMMPVIRATAATRDLAVGGGPVAPPKDEAMSRAYADVVLVNPTGHTRIDLGNRQIELVPLSGHTKSDVAIVDENAAVTFAGDLLWNGMFPNYVDATPTTLRTSIQQLADRRTHTFVGGHGAVANSESVARYLALLDDIERVARAGVTAGRTPAELAASYAVPASLGEWMASKAGVERAMTAWARELR